MKRTFNSDLVRISLISSNQGESPFKNLGFRGSTQFTDIYYDALKESGSSPKDQYVLASKGVWLAKLNQSMENADSQLEEPFDPEVIARIIRDNILTTSNTMTPANTGAAVSNDGGSGSDEDSFGLQEVARYTTFREMWRADHEFDIVLDKTDLAMFRARLGCK